MQETILKIKVSLKLINLNCFLNTGKNIIIIYLMIDLTMRFVIFFY